MKIVREGVMMLVIIVIMIVRTACGSGRLNVVDVLGAVEMVA